MDIINKISNYSSTSDSATTGANPPQLQDTATSGGGGFMGSINERLGGVKSGEKKEGEHMVPAFTRMKAEQGANPDLYSDLLDKSVDFVQEHILKQGPQDNESATE